MYGSRSPLVFISGTLTAQCYIDLVVEPLAISQEPFFNRATPSRMAVSSLRILHVLPGLQRLWTCLPSSTSGFSLVSNCKGSCQQSILMICVPTCITFLSQPLIASLIARVA